MKRTVVLFLLAVPALVSCAEGPVSQRLPGPEISLEQVRLDSGEARRQINAYRESKGLKPLVLDSQLTAAAERHSRDLSSKDRISHRGSDGSNPWDRVKSSGYRAKLAAENVGVGQRSFAEVLQGWKDSPGHNRNLLLPDATQMGVALVVNPATRNQTFWTLVLGTPAKARLASR